MFYRPEEGHSLPHNPFNAIVTPRPIAWISSRGRHGDNLAPYSFFNAVAYTPPQIMFASTGVKDTLNNINETGVFAVNLVEMAHVDAMNKTSAALAPHVDEFTHMGIPKEVCLTIKCPRIANAPATLECKMTQIIPLVGDGNYLVTAEVTGIHMRDDCLINGRFEAKSFHLVARMGYQDYTIVRDVFTLKRPGES